MRDRLRNSRGLKRTETGQRFLEGFAAVRHLRRDGSPGAGRLVDGPARHARVREVVATTMPSGMAWVCSPDGIHQLGKFTLRDRSLGTAHSALNKFPNSC
jgi:hypothetical protein